MHFQVALPVITYIGSILSEHRTLLYSYLFRIFEVLKIADPMRLFLSVMLQQIIGIGYQKHYQELYPEIKAYFTDIKLYGTNTIMEYIGRITNSMAAWKLIIFQSYLLRNHCPALAESPGGKTGEGKTADFDVTTIQSSSSRKEGAEIGFNKKCKGKPCFQLSATFIGRVFTDGKLFPGHCNPKDFFQKAVKRANSLGFNIKNVRADSAYLSLENLLFLSELSLGYAIGAPATFSIVKKGRERFKKLARKKSSAIISVAKGVSVYDFGQVLLSGKVETRLLIVRRISRKKNRKTGKWKIRTYYYAIAANLSLSPQKLYEFYHKRQCIEAGFRELKQHYHLERLPFKSLKANEFWIVCKIVAMTLFKIFQVKTLPKALRTLLRKTFLRNVLQKGLKINNAGKVEVVPKARNTWLLRRLVCKTERIKLAFNA